MSTFFSRLLGYDIRKMSYEQFWVIFLVVLLGLICWGGVHDYRWYSTWTLQEQSCVLPDGSRAEMAKYGSYGVSFQLFHEATLMQDGSRVKAFAEQPGWRCTLVWVRQ